MIARLWLARHGETAWAAEDRYNGRADVPLTARGLEQAARLSARLSAEPLAAVYCSSLRRTVETAAAAARPHGLEPVACPGLVEIDFGVWDGVPRHEIVARYPDLYAAWCRDPAGVAAPGGESGYAALARAAPVLCEIADRHAGQTVLVVAHKAINRLLLCHWLDLAPRLYRSRLGQLPCALNCIEWHAGEPMVTLINDTAHLGDGPCFG